MSHDAGGGEVQRHRYVHERLTILKNCRHEFVHEMTVRAAVTAARHARRQWRAFGVRQSFFKSFIFSVKRSALTADTAHFAAGAGRVPTHRHARGAAVARAEQRALRPERILVRVVLRLQMLDATGNAETGNFRKAPSGHAV